MKKILSLAAIVLAFCAVANIDAVSAQQPKTYKIQAKAPYISPSLKPIIEEYKKGDYTGAMIDLETLLKKEKNNTAAKYYLALCYTKLGFKTNAIDVYNEIVEVNDNMVLVHYSQKAIECIDNPNEASCNPALAKWEADKAAKEDQEEDDDITTFIKSGKQFHPAVQDHITRERMERKLQQQEYSKNNQGANNNAPAAAKPVNPNLKSEAPTNEEIAAALNTLSKIGMNPYEQKYSAVNFLSNPYQYAYLNANSLSYPAMLNSNPELAQMMLYDQLNRQFAQQLLPNYSQTNLNTFGI